MVGRGCQPQLGYRGGQPEVLQGGGGVRLEVSEYACH